MALRHASITSFFGEILLTWITDSSLLLQMCLGSTETVRGSHCWIDVFCLLKMQTSSTIMTFTFAMVKYPRVWKRAQAEIDAVLGVDKLPEFDDRQSLPYVEGIVREILRWKPIGPPGACSDFVFFLLKYP